MCGGAPTCIGFENTAYPSEVDSLLIWDTFVKGEESIKWLALLTDSLGCCLEALSGTTALLLLLWKGGKGKFLLGTDPLNDNKDSAARSTGE